MKKGIIILAVLILAWRTYPLPAETDGNVGAVRLSAKRVEVYKGVSLGLLDLFALEVKFLNHSMDPYEVNFWGVTRGGVTCRPLEAGDVAPRLEDFYPYYTTRNPHAAVSGAELEKDLLKKEAIIAPHGSLQGLIFFPVRDYESIRFTLQNLNLRTKTQAIILLSEEAR